MKRKHSLIATAIIIAATLTGANERPKTVNINTADAETIAMVLTGVGLSKARAIVAYREANGRFDDPSELTEVRGIGDSTVEKNSGRIVIGDEMGMEMEE